MKMKLDKISNQGFSLIELLAVLVIMGVIGSVGVQKLDVLSITAGKRAVLEGVKELNTRETLTWVLIKLSAKGWTSDEAVWASLDTNLGSRYSWNPMAERAGGSLYFKSERIKLKRKYSSTKAAGLWQIEINTL